MVELNQEKARYWGYKEHPYDALLDDFMPGMTVAKCDKLFDVIKPQIIELIVKIKESNETASNRISMATPPIQRTSRRSSRRI